jgi:hypothetical protein
MAERIKMGWKWCAGRNMRIQTPSCTCMWVAYGPQCPNFLITKGDPLHEFETMKNTYNTAIRNDIKFQPLCRIMLSALHTRYRHRIQWITGSCLSSWNSNSITPSTSSRLVSGLCISRVAIFIGLNESSFDLFAASRHPPHPIGGLDLLPFRAKRTKTAGSVNPHHFEHKKRRQWQESILLNVSTTKYVILDSQVWFSFRPRTGEESRKETDGQEDKSSSPVRA